jgi:hypothetical protein
MKVSYSPYSLTPVKRINRLSSMDVKKGVLLKAELKDSVLFADYFPHIPLGDRPVDQFLDEFKFQEVEYDKKIFDLLLRDKIFQKLTPKKFFNHQLWTGSEPLEAPTIKYKLLHLHDRSFIIPLRDGRKVRLDGNAMFDRKEYEEFVNTIPREFHHLVDYIEDPLRDKDWSNLKFQSARDFIESSSFDYYIYKPNCEFRPETDAKIIYSAYLGGPLGQWHTYCELVEKGDLSLTQGITAFNFYQDEKQFLIGSYKEGFIADMKAVYSNYDWLSNLEWKSLCSM